MASATTLAASMEPPMNIGGDERREPADAAGSLASMEPPMNIGGDAHALVLHDLDLLALLMAA